MKTRFLVAISAAMLVLAGCAGEDNEETIDNWKGEIHLSSGVSVQQTRTNSKDVPDKQIAENESVEVVVTKQSTDEKEYSGYTLDFTANGQGGLSNSTTTMYYPESGMGVSIYAYHPSDAGTSFSVQADQSSDGDYFKSDLLYSAKKDYARQKEAHSLTFVHKLCKVEYTLVQGTGTPALTGATVQWMNVAKTIGFTAETGAVATSSDVTTITPHSTYGAIIVPQTVSANTKLLKVTLADGGVLYYTPDEDQTFDSEKKYSYKITVNLSGLSVQSTITEWTSIGEKTGTAEME